MHSRVALLSLLPSSNAEFSVIYIPNCIISNYNTSRNTYIFFNNAWMKLIYKKNMVVYGCPEGGTVFKKIQRSSIHQRNISLEWIEWIDSLEQILFSKVKFINLIFNYYIYFIQRVLMCRIRILVGCLFDSFCWSAWIVSSSNLNHFQIRQFSTLGFNFSWGRKVCFHFKFVHASIGFF